MTWLKSPHQITVYSRPVHARTPFPPLARRYEQRIDKLAITVVKPNNCYQCVYHDNITVIPNERKTAEFKHANRNTRKKFEPSPLHILFKKDPECHA